MDIFDVRDAFYTVGFVMLCGGVAAYDWRLGLITGGVVLIGSAMIPALRRGSD